MTVLSYSYGIIINRAINAPGHVKNVVDIVNKMYKKLFEVKNGTYW